jgi:hypothetical protein
MVREPTEKPLNPDPVTHASEPERIRANVRKMGQDLPQAELKVVLLELSRAGKAAEPALWEALKDENPRRRSNALFVLGFSTNPDTIQHVAPLLRDPVPGVRYEAAGVLVDRGHKEGIPVLIRALRDDSPFIRRNAVRILRGATRQYFGFKTTLPKDKREFCVKKWEAWWAEHGERFTPGRFAGE